MTQVSESRLPTEITPHPFYPMPLVRIDLVLLSVKDGNLQVLLSHRKEAPFKEYWGLPGGVLRIDLDISFEHAAQRVAFERIGRQLENLSQVVAVGGAKRDPRAPWAMSVVYRSMVPPDLHTIPGKRVMQLAWYSIDELSQHKRIAFDHEELVNWAVQGLRDEIRDLHFPAGGISQEFTVGELQAYSEAILGESLDKVTFRRRIDVANVLQAIPGRVRGGAHRPAQLYRFREDIH